MCTRHVTGPVLNRKHLLWRKKDVRVFMFPLGLLGDFETEYCQDLRAENKPCQHCETVKVPHVRFGGNPDL